MSDVIASVLRDLKARQKELQPLVAEHGQVDSAIQALERAKGGPQSPTPRSGPKPGKARRRGSRPRKGESTRADQLLAAVRERPGLTVAEAAERLAVQPPSLYRLVAQLEKTTAIEKRGRSIYPG